MEIPFDIPAALASTCLVACSTHYHPITIAYDPILPYILIMPLASIIAPSDFAAVIKTHWFAVAGSVRLKASPRAAAAAAAGLTTPADILLVLNIESLSPVLCFRPGSGQSFGSSRLGLRLRLGADIGAPRTLLLFLRSGRSTHRVGIDATQLPAARATGAPVLVRERRHLVRDERR